MRRFSLSDLGTLIVVSAILVMAAYAGDGVPVEKSLTLPGDNGGGTVTNNVTFAYTAGVNQAVYTSFEVDALEVVFDSALAQANAATVTVHRASTGPAYHSTGIASGETYQVSYTTNTWYFMRDDTWYVNCTATNAGTVKVIGRER